MTGKPNSFPHSHLTAGLAPAFFPEDPMPLHPDLDAFLALVEAGIQSGRQQPMHRKSVHQARADYEAAAPMLDLQIGRAHV